MVTVFQFEEDSTFNCPEILGRGFSDQLPRFNGKSWQTQWWLRLQLHFCCIPHLNFCVQRNQSMIICNNWRSNQCWNDYSDSDSNLSFESRIFGFGFMIFAGWIIFGFGFVIESWPSNLNLFNIFNLKNLPMKYKLNRY